jgi:hypothetical protein
VPKIKGNRHWQKDEKAKKEFSVRRRRDPCACQVCMKKKKQGLSSSGKKYEKRKGGLVGIVRWTGGEMKRIIPMGRASRDAGEACSP